MALISYATRTRCLVAFSATDPTQTQEITWYFVSDSVEMLPFGSAFGSATWEVKESIEGPIGERFAGRTLEEWQSYFSGVVLGLCGSADQWANGTLPSRPRSR